MFQVTLVIISILSIFYLLMGIISIFQKQKQSPSLPSGHEPTVTIQIPTYNELAALSCAKKCLEFDYPHDKLQIIIGDDSDKQDIIAQIDVFAAQYHENVTVTRRGSNIGFKPGNLNHMLQFTTGEFIAIFDSDFLPQPDYLRKMIFPFTEDENISVVQARWKITNIAQNVFSLMGGIACYITHHIAIPFIRAFGGSAFLCGSGHIIRKSHLDEIGGWQSGTLTEDIEASLELMKRGHKLVYLEDVIVDCEAPFTFRDVAVQQKRWAFGNVLAFKRNFVKVLRSKQAPIQNKFSATIFTLGYIYFSLLLVFCILGFVDSLIPNPIAVSLDVFQVILSSVTIFLLTSGSLIVAILVLVKNNEGYLIPKLIGGTITIGVGLLLYVNVGIYSALFNRKMEWYMLKKQGNDIDLEKLIS